MLRGLVNSLKKTPQYYNTFINVSNVVNTNSYNYSESTKAINTNGDVLTFKTNKYTTHGKIDTPPAEIDVTKDEIIRMYKDMYTIRRIESESNKLYKKREIRGFCHTYEGQEAVCVGLEAGLVKGDHLITAYRDHGYAYTRGLSPVSILAEQMGRATGCQDGKGGSMHMYNQKENFYGGCGIVGAQVSVGTGIAFAQKYNNTGKVCVALYGDGAANQGQVYESYNMASLWNIPVVYVCENNLYGMGTSIERAAASTSFYSRGDYIPGILIDGNNIFTVKSGMKFAADFARENGPVVIEMNTYRYSGHSMSDDGSSYRNRIEVDEVRKSRDPISFVENVILDNNILSEEELKKISKDIQSQLKKATKEALAAPPPEYETLFHDVYAEDTFIRTVEYEDSYYPKSQQ
eukprot:TRINITY_DN41_c1_g1_i1.p1 TRINITY_DN41_c1_g1~~TRINITY_DN41_c1_g1_i1.p1  ORF type:complete len:405 (-),score=157.14 TRINITY_DN41_c1_g1_i1:123-1337(-)